MRRRIASGSPFEASIGYSRAVVAGDWCFVAGTTGANPGTSDYPRDAKSQARNALAIIEQALRETSFALSDVVRVTYYATSAADFALAVPVLGEIFGEIRPAATMLVVAGLLHPDMKIEIEVTAFKGG